jgi:hypothetical protein
MRHSQLFFGVSLDAALLEKAGLVLFEGSIE